MAAQDAARGEPLAKFRVLRAVWVLWFVLGIEMVQGPEGLVEAMRRRQMLVQIAEMVLAKRVPSCSRSVLIVPRASDPRAACLLYPLGGLNHGCKAPAMTSFSTVSAERSRSPRALCTACCEHVHVSTKEIA